MPLATPSYFDEFERIRTRSKPYDPRVDHTAIILQLRAVCITYKYLGASPQNLVSPAELLPALVARKNNDLRNFINPKVLEYAGERLQGESCGNIFLIRDGKKVYPFAYTERPTQLTMSYVRMRTGREVVTLLRDNFSPKSRRQSFLGVIFHELDHLRGRLIADIARERLIRNLGVLVQSVHNRTLLEKNIKNPKYSLPFVLMRDRDVYVLRYGTEFKDAEIPPVSPDALFTDGFWVDLSDVGSTFVPRDGELLPIKVSKVVRSIVTAR